MVVLPECGRVPPCGDPSVSAVCGDVFLFIAPMRCGPGRNRSSVRPLLGRGSGTVPLNHTLALATRLGGPETASIGCPPDAEIDSESTPIRVRPRALNAPGFEPRAGAI